MKTITRYYLFILLVFVLYCSQAQTNNPPTITAVGDQFYCPLSQIPVAENFSITDTDDTSIDAIYIQISTGYVFGEDLLSLTGSHPNIIATWNATEGKLSLEGIGGTSVSFADMTNAVSDVVFSNSSGNVQGERFFSFTFGDANYLPSTDHFYQYVPNLGITWTQARDLAATYSYYGLQGYLATITSAEEAQLSGEQAAGAGWIGGSDEETEGVWKWMTGPEAGTIFWNGGINGSTTNFAFWNTGEPNNLGNEDYAHVTDPSIGIPGSWNDLANTGDTNPNSEYHPKGFIVEYGGTPGDPVLNLSASTKITIPEIITTVNAERCGNGSVTLEATPSHGSILWYDTPTGGSVLATGNTFTTPILTTTTTFYALVSVNGCIEGNRQPVVATIKDIPTITDITEETVCVNSSATIFATPSQGTVTWYDVPSGGTPLAFGNAFNTPQLTTTTTYYAEPEFNGCIGIREEVTATVQLVDMPTANSPQSFCDIENALITDLSVTGTDIKWYLNATGGTALSASEVLNSGTYYATQTLSGCESSTRFPVEVIISETVVAPNTSDIPKLAQCDDDTDGFAVFDLTVNETILLNGSTASNFTFQYFTDASYTNQIVNPSNYLNTTPNGEIIYIIIRNSANLSCFTETQFEIEVLSLPEINPLINYKNCDEDGIPDGFTDYNLTEINSLIVIGNVDDFTISYHLSNTEAHSNTNAVNEVPFNNSTANTLYARVENVSGCIRVAQVNLLVSTTSFPTGYVQELVSCDLDDTPDGFYTFDLTLATQGFLNEFPTGQNLSVHYYSNLNDAQLEQNEIINTTNFTNQTAFNQDIFVRVESEDNGDCFGIGPHLRLIVNERPQFEVDQSDVFCINGDSITLDIYNPSGVYIYTWTNQSGEVVSNQQSAVITVGGNYTVVASSLNGCQSFPYTFNVVESEASIITLDDITVQDFSNNNSITIDTNNLGIGDYEFALDNYYGNYQDEPYFNYVGAGDHVLYVRDKNGCGIVELDVFVLGFPKYFTPNGDMYNQYWNLKGWNTSYTKQSRIYIYDRYGKLISNFGPWMQGWDGTFNGSPLIEADYWFVAKLIKNDGTVRELQGHFSLVR